VIDREQAAELALRLSGLLARPEAPEAVEAVADAIRQAATDAAHARRLVDYLLRETRLFPVPADVWTAAAATRAAPAPARPRCPLCGGTGWRVRRYLVSYHYGPNDGPYRHVEPLTERAAARLRGELSGWPRRMVVEAVERCNHDDPAHVSPDESG